MKYLRIICRFAYVNELGERLLKKSPQTHEIAGMLKRLEDGRQEIHRLWNEKYKQLQDQLELQLFNREADHLDAVTKGHEALLELSDLGVRNLFACNLLRQAFIPTNFYRIRLSQWKIC